jgi:hypothetical protein
LAEGAPGLGVGGERAVGKTLAYLATDFMECRLKNHAKSRPSSR